MGFFKKAFKVVAKPVTSAVKSTVKNAVPLTAAYLTGGASLAVMKPSGGLFDKAFGAVGMGPQKEQSIEQVATEYATEKINNEVGRVALRAATPKNTASKRINSQSAVSRPFSASASDTFDSITNAVGGKSKFAMILGGVGVVIVIMILIGRKK